jgi:hypothetical protein
VSTSHKRVLCMFCDQVGPLAEEDIISRWMSKALQPVGSIHTDFLTEIPGQPITRHTRQFGNLSTLKLPRTCVGCNGGWMSRLEEATRPILEPLIRGVPVALTSGERRQIAAWGQLKCLTLDAYYRDVPDGVQHLPNRVSHEFYSSHLPLRNSLVTLGRYRPPRQGTLLPWGRFLTGDRATPEKPEMNIVIATFAFGQLLIQVLICSWAEPCPMEVAFPIHDARLTRCWPLDVQDHLLWPPIADIAVTDFALVAGPRTRIGASQREALQRLQG